MVRGFVALLLPNLVAAVLFVGSAAARLGGSVVVKAHVSANRRAKAGGVRFADDPESAAQAAEEIFGRLFDGRPADSLRDRSTRR